MNQNEKQARKNKLSEFIDLNNGRFKDYEITQLESIVENRDALNGQFRTFTDSYKSFDSEGTYHVEEKDTYTFRSDDSGIHIDQDFQRNWDDGQQDEEHHVYSTGRDILRVFSNVFKKAH